MGVKKVCYWPTTKGQWYTTISSVWLGAVSHGSSKSIARKRIESSWFYFSVENWSRNKAKHSVSPQDLVIPFTKTNTSHTILHSHCWWERNTFKEPTRAARSLSDKNKQRLCFQISRSLTVTHCPTLLETSKLTSGVERCSLFVAGSLDVKCLNAWPPAISVL